MPNRIYVQCVYGYYQELYDEKSNDFLWPGLAKLAGAPVYAGLSDMQWGIVSSPALTGLNALAPGLTIAECLLLQDALLVGNDDIYSDMAWQFRAYQASGVWAMRYVSDNHLDVASTLDRPIDESDWENIFQGDATSNSSLILSANFLLTQREQQFAVQPAWDQIANVPFGTFLFDHLAVSPVDKANDASFETVVPGGNITIFDNNRWLWVSDPTMGIWHDYTGLSPSVQTSDVDTPLTTRAATYSYFYNWSDGTFTLW